MPIANVPLINAPFGLPRHIFAATTEPAAVEVDINLRPLRKVANNLNALAHTLWADPDQFVEIFDSVAA